MARRGYVAICDVAPFLVDRRVVLTIKKSFIMMKLKVKITRVNNFLELSLMDCETVISPSFFQVARLSANKYAYYARDDQGAARAERYIRRIAERDYRMRHKITQQPAGAVQQPETESFCH